jgi:hypothetical protein
VKLYEVFFYFTGAGGFMSHAVREDGIIGQFVSVYQSEISLAKELAECLKKPILPNGYPKSVYHPRHISRTPQMRQFIADSGGKLSNDVPRVLSMEIVADYPLCIYNHFKR